MEQVLKLYLISQSENNSYDTYDSVVVAAYTEEEARNYNPSAYWGSSAWCRTPDKVEVLYLGVATQGIEAGEILSSFNAG